MFETVRVLDVALRRSDGSTAVDWQRVGVRTAPPLPVTPALAPVLPDGLRRGSTVTLQGSMSLLFALLGAASADGAWCALVGFPPVSAEALAGYGVALRRLALVPDCGVTGWVTAVGALVDALDIVAVRPPRGRAPVPGDVRRLAARARSKDAVLMPYVAHDTQWPGADVRLQAHPGSWDGATDGSGRLRARRVEVSATGRGRSAGARSTQLWLPAIHGGAEQITPLSVVPPLVAPSRPSAPLAG